MKKIKKPSKDVIENALLKKALGYDCSEIVEEYTFDDDGNAKLSKKKVTKKFISPDIPAAKILLEQYSVDDISGIENLSDEELSAERLRLLKLLKDEEGKNGNKKY